MSSIYNKIITAAGGELWQRPKTLQLRGTADFTPYGQPDRFQHFDVYDMYRVFPAENLGAHAANGKVRFDALHGSEVFFTLKYDGQHSQLQLSERAEPYAEHFSWSNNFGFGIIRFADRSGYSFEELVPQSVEGRPCRFIKITDPQQHQTWFGIDRQHYYIRYLGFPTATGYHHRIYSNFVRGKNGWLQPLRIRIFFDGLRWMDIQWRDFEVNGNLPETLFI